MIFDWLYNIPFPLNYYYNDDTNLKDVCVGELAFNPPHQKKGKKNKAEIM